MLQCVSGDIVYEILRSLQLALLGLEDEGTVMLQSDGNYLPSGSVTSQKACIFSSIAMGTSNLAVQNVVNI
jgi:hypothetical protein